MKVEHTIHHPPPITFAIELNYTEASQLRVILHRFSVDVLAPGPGNVQFAQELRAELGNRGCT